MLQHLTDQIAASVTKTNNIDRLCPRNPSKNTNPIFLYINLIVLYFFYEMGQGNMHGMVKLPLFYFIFGSYI